MITATVAGCAPACFPSGTPACDIAKAANPELAALGLAARVNGELWDWTRGVETDATVEILTESHAEAHPLLLHSAAHLLAHAVKELFPEAKLTIGPAIENRFYYDFDFPAGFSEDDLARIEARMREISAHNLSVSRRVSNRAEVERWARQAGESYKLEILEQIPPEQPLTFYTQGEFTDLCRGPHLPSTGYVRHFKLLSTAGTYWRGDEKNPTLQRIYGTAFFSAEGVEDYLRIVEDAKKRDHRRLGRELELFLFDPVAAGQPIFLPKGAVVYNELIRFIRELYREFGYEEVITPQLFDASLWERSGHWEHFREAMYRVELDHKTQALKPMNCPGHTLIYSSKLRSYRELPLRLADFGRLHRFERAGVLSGLTRVRAFSQDDAHIFCTAEQVPGELEAAVRMVQRVHGAFDYRITKVSISTRPEKALGALALWENAERALETALLTSELEVTRDPGEGAFYGPKIDFFVRDALGRLHQLSTIQLDFNLPERFGLEYASETGDLRRPVMIHRAILGSLERFIGLLLEHCGGDFPLWIAPVQLAILPVSEKAAPYADLVSRRLEAEGFRVMVDRRSEKISAKIRDAEMQKVNVMAIVGEKEAARGTLSVRRRKTGPAGEFALEVLIAELKREVINKRREDPSQP